ncbi:MAG TPA: 1,4-alpha-glucan branching enzyme, partial [Chloroflexota bacterium]|nr:1,4-alpha-glucan branching enzyme [Chloroflexota bacterium]
LYLDYSRKEGEWIPNQYGGRENLEAIHFLQRMNEAVHTERPGVLTIAEESTAWPQVSRPPYMGGLGFSLKWNMGWMHDTLSYISKEPIHRRYHHDQMTFSLLYAFHENFVLPFSHDEVVHGKGSLLNKIPGDDWQKFATLRLLYGYMFGHPGKKLLFMGGEIGQWREWSEGRSLDWGLLEHPLHAGVQRWVRDLNTVYRHRPALWETDFSSAGFEWIDFHDVENCVVSFLRRGRRPEEELVFVCNFAPVPRHDYRIGVPRGGAYREVLNSDQVEYGGSGQRNAGRIEAEPVPEHGRPQSVRLTLPPLGVLVLEREPQGE